jgi:hypothetical protein
MSTASPSPTTASKASMGASSPLPTWTIARRRRKSRRPCTCPPRSSFAVSSPISCRRNFGASAITASSSTASAGKNSPPAAPCSDGSIRSVPTSSTWKHSWKGKASTGVSVRPAAKGRCAGSTPTCPFTIHPSASLRRPERKALRSVSKPGGMAMPQWEENAPARPPAPTSHTAQDNWAIPQRPAGHPDGFLHCQPALLDSARRWGSNSIATAVQQARFDRHPVQQERSSRQPAACARPSAPAHATRRAGCSVVPLTPVAAQRQR